jgi:ArsR family transcriptional regulator, arsenate/arsenite/antimonite-responsive transcriptional repressor
LIPIGTPVRYYFEGVAELFMTSTYELPVDEVVHGFHALSDPIRIQIVELLQQQERCVAGLCEDLHSTQSKLSFHLKVLKDAELVHTRHEGRWIYYSLNLHKFSQLKQYLAVFRPLDHSFPQTIYDPSTQN